MLNDTLSNKDLAHFLLLLSEAVDIGTDNLARHQIRTAYIALEIAKELNLKPRDRNEIFLSALFHDIGALSLDYRLSDSIGEFNEENNHCKKGEIILNEFPWLIKGAKYVRYHHTTFDKLKQIAEPKYHLGSQIIFLADYVDRITSVKPPDCVIVMPETVKIKIIDILASGYLMKSVFDAFEIVSRKEYFWFELNSPTLLDSLFKEEALFGLRNKVQVSDILKFIINLVDSKSYYTVAHSTGTAVAARSISSLMNFNGDDIEWSLIGGYLHDIGKIAVPTRILDKPGKLTKEEYLIIKRHPYYSYRILSSVEALQQYVGAAFHHENGKGTGYPFNLSENELSDREKVIGMADIFTALYEDRPYRKKLPEKEIIKIIDERVGAGLTSSKIADVVKKNYGDIAHLVRNEQKKMLELYHNKFGSID